MYVSEYLLLARFFHVWVVIVCLTCSGSFRSVILASCLSACMRGILCFRLVRFVSCRLRSL